MRTRLPSLLVLLITSACVSSRESAEELGSLGVSQQEARIEPEQAAMALAIATSTEDYLAYGYTPDGCYARALFMSMELAARGIPSTSQFINGSLHPSEEVAWAWHVAPLVELRQTRQRVILDPALSTSVAFPLERWVETVNPSGSFQLEWTLGSQYASNRSARRNKELTPLIQSFAELAPFRIWDISSACAVMHSYLAYESTTPQERDAKRALLLRRTQVLSERLASIGKLDSALTPSAKLCGSITVPACAAVASACSNDEDCCSMLCVSGACADRPIDLVTDAGTLTVDGGTEWLDAGTLTSTAPDGGVLLPEPLENGVPVTKLAARKGTARLFAIDVPGTAKTIRFETRGGGGDADLYVRSGAPPSLWDYDYRPLLYGSSERVDVDPALAGTWYVLVQSYETFSNVTLTASWTE